MIDVLKRLLERPATAGSALVILSSMAAFGIGIVTVVGSFNRVFPSTPTPTPIVTATPSAIETELVALRDQVVKLQYEVDTMSQIPADVAIASQLAQTQDDLDNVDKRLELMELVILDDPVKAMEMALLSANVQDLRESYTRDLEAIRGEFGNIYEQNKWFLGLMITTAGGVFLLAIGNLPKNPPGSPTKKRTRSNLVSPFL